MALSFTNLVATTDTTDATSHVVSMSRAITANALALATVIQRAGSDPGVPSLSGGGVTWVQVDSYLNKSSVSVRRHTMFRAMAASPSGTSLTADHNGVTATGCSIIVDEITGATTSGTNGSGAIAQTARGDTDVGGQTTKTMTLPSSLASSGNAVYATFNSSQASSWTIGGGGTELAEAANGDFTNCVSGYEVGDNSISGTASVADYIGAIAVEIAGGAFTQSVSGSITPTGTLTKATTKLFSGSITPTGALTRAIGYAISLAGSITPVGDLFKATTKLFSGSITPTGTLLATRVRRFLTALASGVLTLTGRSENTLTLTPDPEDENTLALTPLDEEEA